MPNLTDKAPIMSRYIVPAAFVLKKLGVHISQLKDNRVAVSVDALKQLIAEALMLSNIDEDDYVSLHPDVRGAILAGEIHSGIDHFVRVGYYENRLPGPLSFDPIWYHTHYSDIASRFTRDEENEMREHFFAKGYFEGRSGTEEDFHLLQKWTDVSR